MDTDRKLFGVMWDQLGLETVQEIPHPSLETWAVLTNTRRPSAPNLNHWALRARLNNQRHYEIWLVETDTDITATDIRQMFDTDPQYAADTVRERGTCFYNNRANINDIVIT